ncbi:MULTISPECIES: helix-turn-helix domain-containing protein [unclassified Rhodococcus (in: high G+C Gram-positive bacteria)]|uniref:helix-turn-helix domain-containing protein n=1 Tax=unclassified Rhodococcus (in: high G+C Gram-positive bacteria) TaxID=192944 RepID=UPI0015C5AB32|nr:MULTISPECIES: helix-turn-helix domain-containing protein [unclassified Rhodococcus (in: high G+C Gram-positive bacteria)]
MPKRHGVVESVVVDPDEVLTARQLANDWRVSVRTIQRYASSGQLKAIRLPGGQLRIKRSDAAAAARAPLAQNSAAS